MPSESLTLTSIPGLLVGHAQDFDAATGCTVVLCPEGTTAAVSQRGGAPGTRETDLLGLGRLVQHPDAVLLTGGSAFGLAAADGVVRFLEERGRGFATRAGRVPIVPAAVLYDLDLASASRRPDAAMGYAACAAASPQPVAEGSAGAGTGCRVGSLRGPQCATKGGIGSAGLRLGSGAVVAALVAVNAFGDVLDERGELLAGLRSAPRSRRLASSLQSLLGGAQGAGPLAPSTVIGVVATSAALSRDQLLRVVEMAHDGLARAVSPAHTPWDGDTIFALSKGTDTLDASQAGAAAAEAVATAIRRAVRQAVSLGGVPALRDFSSLEQ
jgi:L-aminopeptidase/D-esterase-like protein